jgi:hypothetical protein
MKEQAGSDLITASATCEPTAELLEHEAQDDQDHYYPAAEYAQLAQFTAD